MQSKKKSTKRQQAGRTLVGRINPEVLQFTVGKDPELDLELAECDCIGSAAHVTMLSRLRLKNTLFTPRQVRQVIAELVSIMKLARAGGLRITAEDQDIHLAVERMLTDRLGTLGKRIHTARSRNDQVAVDLRLYGKRTLLDTMESVIDLVNTLLAFADEHRLVPMVGRTHLQPAMPSSVGLWASGYAESLLDDMTALTAAFETNDRCPLGSAAGYGVPVRIDRNLTSKLLGFREPVHNVLYASNARGKVEFAILSAYSQVLLTLSRMAEDLILYSMPEFAYFELPAEYCTGSSIMPQKKNPDVLELIRAKSARVLGCATAVAGVMKGLAGGYNRDLQETKEPFIEGTKTTLACVRMMNLVMKQAKVNGAKLTAAFTPDVFATDRALELVASGMPFREAYDYVKVHLDELKNEDPHAAVLKKTHLGSTAGLDLRVLSSKSARFGWLVDEERNRFSAAVSKLLGIRYL